MPQLLAETSRLLLELLQATADIEYSLTDERSMLIHDIRNEIKSSMTVQYPSPRAVSLSEAQFKNRKRNLMLEIERGKAISEASETAKKQADAAEKVESSKSDKHVNERGSAGPPCRKRKWASYGDWERPAVLTEERAIQRSQVPMFGHRQALQQQEPQPYYYSSHTVSQQDQDVKQLRWPYRLRQFT